MSSYGSTHSGYLHPSQYPPAPQQPQPQPQHHPQPPYPTTPGPPPTSQPQPFYPPNPQHHQPTYSNSPASPWQQPPFSTSPTQTPQYPFYSSSPGSAIPMPQPQHRRSSSLSQHARPQFGSAPIAIPARGGQPAYVRNGSHSSHHAQEEEVHDNGQVYGVLDEETLRQYEKRYAKERALEKRPTLGGSVMSVFRALGGKRE